MSTSIHGLVQARMASVRLPGKAMCDLVGKPLIWHVFDRLRRVTGLDGVVLATTGDPRNDGLVRFAEAEGVLVHREDVEDDIAARLAGAAASASADAVLKVNADCPFIDPAVLKVLVERFRATPGADYVSNKVVWSYPKGLSAEIISARAIDWCSHNLTTPNDREYMADYIRDHRQRFTVVSVESDHRLGHLDWMVDTPADLAWIQTVFGALYSEGECFGLHDVLAYLNIAERTKA